MLSPDSTMAPPWRFSVGERAVWRARLGAAPTEESKRAFWDIAVPQLARVPAAAPTPCVVVCRVSAPAIGRAPAGPRNRAKGLLDALHDDRRSGPLYRDLPGQAPLQGDAPSDVCGLAVEVVAGAPATEYLLGASLVITGELVASIAVDVSAPNDIVATPGERQRIADARQAFGAAVRAAFIAHTELPTPRPSALVIRHHPQRDEDNTWSTWVAAVCGARGQRTDAWCRVRR